MSVRKKFIFILGDFNENLLLGGNKFSSLIRNNKLTQIIDKPTRITSTSATLLALIITNNPDLVLNHDVVPQVIADHDLISVQINVKKPKRQPNVRTFCHFRDYSKDIFSSILLQNSPAMNKIFVTDNVNEQVNIFTNIFIECLDKCAPIVTKVVRRPSAPWMSDAICQAIEARNRVRTKLKGGSYNVSLQNEYKRKKKQVTTLIRNAKSYYYNE